MVVSVIQIMDSYKVNTAFSRGIFLGKRNVKLEELILVNWFYRIILVMKHAPICYL